MSKKPDRRSDARPCSSSYPAWVCGDCGEEYGRSLPTLATWHEDECDVCGYTNAVTEPRDFGHLKDGWQERRKLSYAEVP